MRRCGGRSILVGKHLSFAAMPKWTPEEVVEIARRRRVLGGADPLSDEQIMQIQCPGSHEPTADIGQRAPKSAAACSQMLVSAIAARNIYMVRDLLEHGADANQRFDGCGATPLMMAIGYTHLRDMDMVGCLQALLEHGADANLVDHHNFTALHHAFRLQRLPAQDLLLARGALPKRCSSGRCQKCTLSAKLVSRRKPAVESALVKEPAKEAAEAKRKAKAARGTFDQVLAEEFGAGDFSALAQKVLESASLDESRKDVTKPLNTDKSDADGTRPLSVDTGGADVTRSSSVDDAGDDAAEVHRPSSSSRPRRKKKNKGVPIIMVAPS